MIGVFGTGRWTSLIVTAVALVLCLSTWFSATSVAPTLVSTLSLRAADEIWLTNAVQAGFVFRAAVRSGPISNRPMFEFHREINQTVWRPLPLPTLSLSIHRAQSG